MKTVLAILILVLVLLQVRLWTGAGGMTEIARLKDRISEQTEENANLEIRNSALMEEVGDLRNGLDSIEERARNELGLIRHGETFYLIVEEEGATDGPDLALSAGQQTADQTAAHAVTQMPLMREVAETPSELMPQPAPLELPPEIVEDDNPYLDIFRDDEDAPGQGDEEAAATGLTVGQ